MVAAQGLIQGISGLDKVLPCINVLASDTAPVHPQDRSRLNSVLTE
jgi:hypothetical protein